MMVCEKLRHLEGQGNVCVQTKVGVFISLSYNGRIDFLEVAKQGAPKKAEFTLDR